MSERKKNSKRHAAADELFGDFAQPFEELNRDISDAVLSADSEVIDYMAEGFREAFDKAVNNLVKANAAAEAGMQFAIESGDAAKLSEVFPDVEEWIHANSDNAVMAFYILIGLLDALPALKKYVDAQEGRPTLTSFTEIRGETSQALQFLERLKRVDGELVYSEEAGAGTRRGQTLQTAGAPPCIE